jgi:hypothetical protein
MVSITLSVTVKVTGCELGGMKVLRKVSHILDALEIVYLCFCFCNSFYPLFILACVEKVWHSARALSLSGE